MVHKRKLIEVALPLEAINRESAREKSIRHGHPSTLHLWWARRPLAAARAVLFSQLVDDPSSRPDEFPTEEEQRAERERLHNLIERLVVWENARDPRLLEEARREILKSTNDRPPVILDPFAGGGTIPLEAQRLGLKARGSDLNPVAVLINRALADLPARFADHKPVFPGLAASEIRDWSATEGLAEDIRAYGAWVRDEARQRIGHLYPLVALPDGSERAAIAWIWARTILCPNPACGIEAPLVRTWWLGKKKGKEAYVVPTVLADASRPAGKRVEFGVGHDTALAPPSKDDGTVIRGHGTCLACDSPIPNTYIREQATKVGLGTVLIALVCEGNRQRIYLAPTVHHEAAARIEPPEDVPTELITTPNHDVDRLPMYGMPRWCDAYTPRQLVALTTLSDLVVEARDRIVGDGGSPEYANAVATYLGMAVSRMTDYQSSLAAWSNNPKNEVIVHVFGRQAIPMTWDFGEGHPLAESSGSYLIMIRAIANVVERLVPGAVADIRQADAASTDFGSVVISTDPPYYDNIGYSDLSDYFYVWLRRALRSIQPDLFDTVLVPKAAELVANPYRHGGRQGAKEFFESGFREVFARARATASDAFPITVYYAFKQSESSASGEASTGWETLLEGMIRSGWEITSTWPVRTELSGRLIGNSANALASSIVLSLRPRHDEAPTTDRRGFIAALESELPDALRKLQQGQVAPVDLPQAAIGPGMAVFSRYSAVLEPDGSKMPVRSALSRINEILDQVLNEQEGDFDPTSRFAIAWYRQYGYGVGKFGDADNLARARNTSVDVMDRDEILTSRGGIVQLIKPADLSWGNDVLKDLHTSNWEALHHLIKVLERDGLESAGDFLRAALARVDGAVNADLLKELAHLLFRIAEGNGWTKDALGFNTLVASWPEILDVARSVRKPVASQVALDFDEGDD
ncbi:DUF1156 domain-containing protein [Nocardia salmonicida]|uniref:DUF1156 domain-containing protein n=1 Tax=Nocardia salmonicida TaxID=53431 RepID=UPI0037B56D24